MINVLIVDDKEQKIESIKKVLCERCQIDLESISEAYSISSAIKALNKSQYHLMILDLVLPQFDNEDPDEKGGLSLLKDLNEKQNINLPVQIICLTEYAEIITENQQRFDQLLVSSVVKLEGDSTWVENLVENVNKTIKLNEKLKEYYSNNHKYDVGIICALPQEFEQLLIAFGEEKWNTIQYDDLPYSFKTCFVNTASMRTLRVIAACAGGAGLMPTSILSTIMYREFKVDQLYMTGFTGGFGGADLELGDIIVSKAVQNYPVGKITESDEGDVKLLKELNQIQVNPQLLNMMEDFVSKEEEISIINTKIRKQNLAVKERDSYHVFCGPTVCVPFVLASIQVQTELKQENRKNLGIDMEGFALYYCAHQLSKKALWIKGVSDMADKDKDDRYHKTCAFGSAMLLLHFLKSKF